MSIAAKGKKLKPETIEKIVSKTRGRKRSEEFCKKMSEARKGSGNPMYGKKLKPEHIEIIKKTNTGRKHTKETKERLSESQRKRHKERPMTEELKRHYSEIFSGEKSCMWRGGISFEPYCPKFNREFKRRVRGFFGNRCVLCGKNKEENKDKNLYVHHVNYDKMVCCNDVKPLFVTLCIECHGKTNHYREEWEEYFTTLIIEKYNGQCYLSKK